MSVHKGLFKEDLFNNIKHTKYTVIQIHASVICTFEQRWTSARTRLASPPVTFRARELQQYLVKMKESQKTRLVIQRSWDMAVEGEVEVSVLESFASRICCIFAFSFLLRDHGALWVLSMPDFVGRVDCWSQNSHGWHGTAEKNATLIIHNYCITDVRGNFLNFPEISLVNSSTVTFYTCK